MQRVRQRLRFRPLGVEQPQPRCSEAAEGKRHGPADAAAPHQRHGTGRRAAKEAAEGPHETAVVGVKSQCARALEDDRIAGGDGRHDGVLDLQLFCDAFLVGVGDVEAAIAFVPAPLQDRVERPVKVGRDEQVVFNAKAAQPAGGHMKPRRLGAQDVVADQPQTKARSLLGGLLPGAGAGFCRMRKRAQLASSSSIWPPRNRWPTRGSARSVSARSCMRVWPSSSTSP